MKVRDDNSTSSDVDNVTLKSTNQGLSPDLDKRISIQITEILEIY